MAVLQGRSTRTVQDKIAVETAGLWGDSEKVFLLSKPYFDQLYKTVEDAQKVVENQTARGINQLNALDTSQIQRAASALTTLGKAVGSISTVSTTSKQVADLAKAISQLGYKSSTQALENIPKLATSMKELMATLSKAPKVSQNLIDMTNALAGLARTGASSGRAATSLGKSLKSYTTTAAAARKSSFSLAAAIGRLYATYWLVLRVVRKLAKE